MDATNLEVGIVVKVDEVCVSLSEVGKSLGSMELGLELIDVVVVKLEEVVGTADAGGVSHGRVMIIVDETTYDGQIISSLGNRDEVVDEGFWKKNWGVLFSKWPSFVVVEIARGFSFGIETEWSRLRKPSESGFGVMGPAWILILFG